MHEKAKQFELNGETYQFRRMTPAVGSYIWQRLMAACYKAGAESTQSTTTEPEAPETDKLKPSAEERVRGLCGVAFMFFSFTDLEFVQKSAMKVTSKYEPDEKGRALLPVMSDDGRWTDQALAESPFLVTRLTVEVLCFNLASFLA
jgi:hypothetical protein